jgi:hypothetical protein
MQIIPLVLEEAAYSGFTHKLVLTSADIILLTSGTAASIYPTFNTAVQFPAGTYIFDAVAVVKTAFAGQAGTLTFGVTDTATNAIIASGTSLITAGYVASYNLTKPQLETAAAQLLITVTSQNAIAGWTAGELHIYVALADLATLDR